MTAARWKRIKDILAAVEDLTGDARAAALAQLCSGDDELRREIDSLLEREERIELFDRPPSVPPAPKQIGAYRIEGVLGSGGMGTVYLGERSDDQYRKRVAIKLIKGFGGPEMEQRFRTERQILATLDHPSIVGLLDGGVLTDGQPYLVMEYVEGKRIDQYVDEKRCGVEEILRLFLKVCAAVQFAHESLIVHRDLKPGNILVTEAGEPRLLDFGIAKVLADGAAAGLDTTRPFERVLTPSSASPEQVAGGPVTTATDVYSLGVLLYRLLTGVSPYEGAPGLASDVAGVIQRHEPPPASKAPAIRAEVARVLAGDLDTVIRKAMEKDPGRRYRTVDEFAADVQRWIERRPVAARPASYLYRAGKFVRRNRVAVAAAGLLGAAIAAGITGTVWYAQRARAEKLRADQRYEALRRLSESLLFEFHDSIANVAGTTEARALVVRRAIEYLDQLAAENGADAAVQSDLAAAYVKIGSILSAERGPHLGGPDALASALASYEKSLAIRRRLFTANPSDPNLRRAVLDSLWSVAMAKQMQGRLNDALDIQSQRLRTIEEVPEPQRTPDLRYSLGTTLGAIGDLYRTLGQTKQALEYGRRALAVREALIRADPKSTRALRAVALSHEFVAYALASEEQYLESAQEHSLALAGFHELAARDPANIDLQRNLYVAESNLCETLTRAGELADAAGHCRRNVSIAEAMYASDHENLQTTEDLASAYATIGFAAHTARRLGEARNWELRAIKQFEAALAKDPGSISTSEFYAEALLEAAKIERELRDRAACGHIQRAREVSERLTRQAPGDQGIARTASEARAAACPSQ